MLSDANGRPGGDSEGSGVGDLWWYACTMLEMNSDMGMSKTSGLLAARKMRCKVLGRVAWACGVTGSCSSCWGWELWTKRPKWSLD